MIKINETADRVTAQIGGELKPPPALAQPTRGFTSDRSTDGGECGVCGGPLADSLEYYQTILGFACATCWRHRPRPAKVLRFPGRGQQQKGACIVD